LTVVDVSLVLFCAGFGTVVLVEIVCRKISRFCNAVPAAVEKSYPVNSIGSTVSAGGSGGCVVVHDMNVIAADMISAALIVVEVASIEVCSCSSLCSSCRRLPAM
jgi:hypothetical protein